MIKLIIIFNNLHLQKELASLFQSSSEDLSACLLSQDSFLFPCFLNIFVSHYSLGTLG